VPSDPFKDDCLVLAGHGSTVNADSSGPIRNLVELFQRRRCFARVTAGFWKEDPPLSTVLSDVTESRVFIVPFFVSEGYFSEEVVPRELGLRAPEQSTFPRVQRRGAQTLFYCKPIGTHDSMTGVILSRARSVVADHPFPRKPLESETALFIAGHGTARNAESRKSVEHQARLIREMRIYADVQAVFMEEEPRIADCHRLAGTRNIVVVPFFLSDGLHVCEDIPVLLGETKQRVQERFKQGHPTWCNPTERHGKRIWYSAAVGTDPVIAEVIWERVREAAQFRSAAS
jgi:sirohydrochlorin cobaltochelatase